RAMAAGPLSVRVGAALAGQAGGARRAVRAAAVGSAAAVVAVVAVATFGSSLDRLASHPAFYGQDFDLAAWDGYGRFEDEAITDVLSRDPDVAAISMAADASGVVGGREASLLALSDMGLGPTVTAGRVPAADDEVVLSRRLAARLGAGVGDRLGITVGESSRRYRVVGAGVLPSGTGDGVLFTLAGLRRVAPDAEVGFQYVRVRPGGSTAAVDAHFQAAFGQCGVDCMTRPAPPTDVSYLDRIGNLPNLLAAALAVLGVAATIHALVLVGRRNRRSLAALRAVGATRAQAARVVLVQATLVACAAAVVGVPLGWAAGRTGWRLFADDLGVVPDPTTPWLASLGVMAALFVLAHAAAVLPSRSAARTPVATALREER
ncbi:MAG: ABC transporter permease, partial [Acidimicrobiia bacterium]